MDAVLGERLVAPIGEPWATLGPFPFNNPQTAVVNGAARY